MTSSVMLYPLSGYCRGKLYLAHTKAPGQSQQPRLTPALPPPQSRYSCALSPCGGQINTHTHTHTHTQLQIAHTLKYAHSYVLHHCVLQIKPFQMTAPCLTQQCWMMVSRDRHHYHPITLIPSLSS